MNFLKRGLMIFALFAGCHAKQSEQSVVLENDAKGFDFRSEIKYADCFNIIDHNSFKQVIVFDVWNNNDTLSNFILLPKGSERPANLPKHEYMIPVPISSIAPLSSSHLGFIALLNELGRIKGVANGERLFNKKLQQMLKNGALIDLGTAVSTNLETLLDLSPEVVMKTGFEDVRNNDKRILESGIPLTYNIEWMESSMLGRAEWVKYIGALFCKEREADSVFRDIEKEYIAVSELIKDVDEKPTVLYGSNYKGTWFLPGGKSYVAQLIKDAGGDYHYQNESSKGSIPLSFEIVLENLVDADVWIGPNASSLPELLSIDERYEVFKAYKTGQVYNNDNRITPEGGNDYWESGVARPDLMLKDFITILQPGLLTDHELHFYRRLTNEPHMKTPH